MKPIKCWAKVDYNIEWTGTPEKLVEYMDKLSEEFTGQGLDSMDVGDAMGFIMNSLDNQPGGFIWELKGYGKLVAEKNYETFVWDNLTDTQENIMEEIGD